MPHVKLTSKNLPLLSLVVLVLLVTILLPVDHEGRYFSLLFHSTVVPGAGENHRFYYSAASLPHSAFSTKPVTPETIHYECQQTHLKEKSVYDRHRVQEEQLKRRAHLQEVCHSDARNSTITELNRKHFLIDRNRQILYCWVHKVASTSWISFLAQLRGLRVRTKRIYREISRLSASSNEEVRSAALDFRVRFIVVRHPFTRLISAYRDRIWAATQKYSAQALTHVPRIFRLTRPHLFRFHSSSSITRNNSRTLAIVPTFEEFVQYLLVAGNVSFNNETHQNIFSKPTFDVHWIPYYQHCSVCGVPFNIIIKLETIEDDKNYLMEELGLKTFKVRDTENMIDEPNRVETKNESNVLSASLKNILSYMKHSNTLQSEERYNITEFHDYKSTPQNIKKILQPTTKLGSKSSEPEELQSIGTNLEHLQISNIGPPCPCYYFSQLTSEQLQGLTKIYERDLNIFGYSTDEYKSCLDKNLNESMKNKIKLT